eukprot:GCRY01008002.1.p1 GENE.GCRY01008002.1~~GCRY01008002.1.p1  ORF type:complete len:212 (-),score=9.87 GCRY01008002.1:517-1152(-)
MTFFHATASHFVIRILLSLADSFSAIGRSSKNSSASSKKKLLHHAAHICIHWLPLVSVASRSEPEQCAGFFSHICFELIGGLGCQIVQKKQILFFSSSESTIKLCPFHGGHGVNPSVVLPENMDIRRVCKFFLLFHFALAAKNNGCFHLLIFRPDTQLQRSLSFLQTTLIAFHPNQALACFIPSEVLAGRTCNRNLVNIPTLFKLEPSVLW